MSPLFDRVDVTETGIRYVMGEALRSSGYILDDLILDYGDSAGDLRALPEQVALITGVLNVAPLVWVTGADVSVPFRDEALEHGLAEIREEMRRIYPDAAWHGTIRFDGPETPRPPATDRSAALFSGGLDSIATLFRHIDEKPVLITVAGSDIAIEDLAAWDRVKTYVCGLGKTYGCENVFVRGNMKRFVDVVKLRLLPPLIKERIGWWLGVQHGMALTGLAAPIAWSKGVGRLYIASSHVEEFTKPWGSSPEIDNNIAWTGVQVVHDGFELSRQMKIADVLETCERRSLPRPLLRVCASKDGDHSTNCGECEKCLRTLAGIMAEGEDPQLWGFDAEPPVALARIRAAFDAESLRFTDNELFMWSDVKKRAVTAERGDPGLRDWMNGFDFEAYRRLSHSRGDATVRFRKLVSGMPLLYKAAVRAKQSAKALRRRLTH